MDISDASTPTLWQLTPIVLIIYSLVDLYIHQLYLIIILD
ncbi:hypothetical protein HMPREF0973_00261 [Prevotella veroralis F0319]|uniref:Uncharacterized protein n=1 Tax=Prevotella veroralis F0319 TaxID=649761 RepID=C9MKY6_9BACT|nr:hypothetical protein HMPREF0973_00261 [Prevotella veroralis F0319]